MVVASEWLDRSDWRKRSAGFGSLRARAVASPELPIHSSRWEVVTFAFAGSDSGVVVADELWSRWRALPSYPGMFRVVDAELQYAAIDWDATPLSIGANAALHARVAGYGLEISYALDHVAKLVGLENAGWFANPIAKLMLDGELKVAFVTTDRSNSGACDERALVSAAGQAVLDLVVDKLDDLDDPLGTVLRGCVSSQFETLEKLRVALRKAGAPKRLRPSLRASDERWAIIHHALGLVQAGLSEDATRVLTLANRRWRPDVDLEVLLADVRAQVVVEEIEVKAPAPTPPVIPPTKSELVERAFRARDYKSGLAHADAWLATEPEEPRAHHVRGKALLSLGRLVDARAAFDRACALRPQMLEAMLLRGEVDRTIAKLRGTVGTSLPMQMKLPEHLGELRDTLISGRTVDAIVMLQRAAYDSDEVAQLLLGELLSADQRYDEALAVYAKLSSPEAALGTARTYLALDRAADALIAVDAAMRPGLDEALELRARVLLALNRVDEADAQHAAYMLAIERRSDRRVHSL